MKEEIDNSQESEIKGKQKKKEGMTIIEVLLSFTIALILIMALYSIVYWGSITFSDLNQKLIDVGNATIFIQTELTRNAGKYFYLEPITGREGEFNLKINADTPSKIFNLINTLGYNRYGKIKAIRIGDPQRVNTANLYKVEVEIEFEHKSLRRINKIEVYLTANSFKVGLIQPDAQTIDVGTFVLVSPTQSTTTTISDTSTITNDPSTALEPTTNNNDPTTELAPTTTTTTATTIVTTTTTTTTTTSGGEGGGAGGSGCFELSSLVLTRENNNYKLKKMSDVKVGDIVITIDPVENYKLKELEVEKIHIHDEQEYEILELITQNSKIRLTPNHPLIIDENNTLKKAGKLNIGDKILVYRDGNYNWQEIKEIRQEIIKDKVMTLELKGEINTFLVSVNNDSFVLAHSGYSHINLLKLAAIVTPLTISLILIQNDVVQAIPRIK